MPSLLNQLIYKEIKQAFEESPTTIFINYNTFTQEDSVAMRAAAKASNGVARVVKNSVTQKVMKDMEIEGVDAVLQGPVLALMGEDPVGLSKAAMDFLKKNKKGDVLGALVDGVIVDVESVKKLSKLPSKEALHGQVLSVMVAPIRGLVTVLGGNIRGLVTVLSAIKDQKEKEAA